MYSPLSVVHACRTQNEWWYLRNKKHILCPYRVIKARRRETDKKKPFPIFLDYSLTFTSLGNVIRHSSQRFDSDLGLRHSCDNEYVTEVNESSPIGFASPRVHAIALLLCTRVLRGSEARYDAVELYRESVKHLRTVLVLKVCLWLPPPQVVFFLLLTLARALSKQAFATA